LWARATLWNSTRRFPRNTGASTRARTGEKYTDALRDFLLHVVKVKQVMSFVVFGGLSGHVARDRIADLAVYTDPENQHEHILVGVSQARPR
jgi:hypothetical protein